MRKILRRIAKTNIKKHGIHKPFKKGADGSYFSKWWRVYAHKDWRKFV